MSSRTSARRSSKPSMTAQQPSPSPAKSLDDSNEGKLDPAEESKLKHFHFHPHAMSDVEIVYGNSVFHCHRVILALKAKVFEALFSEASVTDKRITYPEQRAAHGIIVDESNFYHFLLCFYFPFQGREGFSLQIPKDVEDSGKFDHIQLMHLFHYFQVPEMENRLIAYLNDGRSFVCTTASCCDFLLAAEIYQIPQAKKILIEKFNRNHQKNKEGNMKFLQNIEEAGKIISPAIIHEIYVERMNYLVSTEK